MDLAVRKTTRAQLTKLINQSKDIITRQLNSDIVDEIDRRSNGSGVRKNHRVQRTSDGRRCRKANVNGETTSQAPSPAGSGTSPAIGIQTTVKNTVRLPKLELKKFNGDIATWPEFWEQFKQSVHDSELDDVGKFAYLKSYLTGRAAATIAGLTSSGASYVNAIELLKAEFGNSQRIVDSYETDINGLRKLFNTASTIIKSLATLGIAPEQYGLLNSDDSVSVSGDSTQSADYNKELINLLQFIKIELCSLEQAECVTTEPGKDRNKTDNLKSKQGHRYAKNKDNYTVAGLLTEVKNVCFFCKSSDHTTPNCNESLTLTQKKDKLKADRRCYRWTKPKHLSKECKTNIKCRRCLQRHATTVCERRKVSYQRRTDDEDTATNSTSLLTNGQLNKVYLQTACAQIVTKDDNATIRLVLDGGSQLTFIRECISRQLRLKVIGKHKISIQPFGERDRTPAKLCNRVQVNLKCLNTGNITQINAVEVPEICFDTLNPPTLNEPAIRQFAAKYQLADSSEEGQRNGIVLLIGADYYWKLVTGEVKQLTNGLTAVNSTFGWTIHGPSSVANQYDFMVSFNTATVLHAQVTSDSMDLKRFWSMETLGINATANVQGAIGVTADIEKAFLQISINDNDRDVLRFLWYKDPVPENLTSAMELSNITTYRMKRVTFWIISSPFLLATTLRKHFEDQPEKLQNTSSILSKPFYVDDLVTAASTVDEAQNLYSESMQILQAANMNLRKWCSNDATMMAVFQTNEKVTRQGERKVLGILWHTLHDELGVSVQSEEEDTVPTKRKVLKTVAKIYDPLGLLGPCTVKAKILLQALWKKKLNWDDVLDPEQSGEWSKWCKELNDLSELRVPRCIIPNKRDKVDLHIFAGASPYAYGAVAYIRCLSNNECNYVMSKNRVDKSGQRELTLPKLELTAALCEARLQNYIAKNMLIYIQKTTLWSDSKISLYWIRGKSKKWKPYVQNRVNEIHKLSDSVWRYCPGKENPADLLTRGISAKTLIESNLWLRGPKWLKDEENWPNDEYFEPDVDQVSSLLTIQRNESTPETQPIFPLEKYGTYEKIMRITAYVIRFIKLTKKMYKSKRLSTQDLNEADTYWIKYTQVKDLPNELKALKRGMPIQSSSSILMLKPFLDENGVMRLLGRLDEAPLSYDEKHPIILPKRSMLTEKIMRKCHEGVNHYGVNATLAELRKRFWVPQGRQKVKAVLNQCLKCKRLKAKPGNEVCAPLPKTRVTMTNPFNITGIDFAGPLYANVAGQRTKT
ncbi:uncharacterized protein [Onthophagus taurus]|uniref:uncharacterized protein n=1 Tax=Onthophagus taurus TaxID=166361 RepID=UPI0039BE7861